MTVQELSDEFDIHYNSIASNQAPGLDLYEKSVFLSKAQLELVKNHFTPEGNKYRKGFEESSKRRTDLRELVKGVTMTTEFEGADHIHPNSKFFRLPNDTFLIISEQALIDDYKCGTLLRPTTDKLYNANSKATKSTKKVVRPTKYVKVIPKTHDEYNTQIDNPFKQPVKDVVWRLDFSSINTGLKNVELLTLDTTIRRYKLRYVKYPKPIILTNLDTLYPGEGLSIDGQTNEQTSELDASIHREIVDRAVELATMDYKPQELQARTQINLRNE